MFINAKTKQDFSIIEKLAKEIWTEHYTPIIGQEQVAYMLEKFNSAEWMSKQAENPNCPYFIIICSDRPIGYIALEFREDYLFLNKFYIKSTERGKGFGRKAMDFIEKQAKEKRLERITLRVNKLNINTITKYEKLGFSKIEAIVQDIGNDFVMDDYVMEKKLFF